MDREWVEPLESMLKVPEQPPKSPRVFVCPWCEMPALATIQGVAYWDGLNKDRTVWEDPPCEYTLVQCSECRLASVQVRADYGEGFEEDSPIIAYPTPRGLSWQVPEPLRREFEEARTCFAAKAYEATVVMVRRILEGTCRENNVQERTLVRGLAKLKEEGVIDSTLAEWADALRILGNEGAHYTGKQVQRDDSEDALAFAEALLDHIYVLRKRFVEFETRRASKRAAGTK
jgi:hypothetical protein